MHKYSIHAAADITTTTTTALIRLLCDAQKVLEICTCTFNQYKR